MTGREHIGIEELADIRPEIEKFVNKKSIVQKVWGFLTFVNIIWFFAIIGLCFSVIPCIMAIFGPIIERFISWLSDVIKQVIEFILKKIIIPLVDFCHNWGIFEVLG